MMTMVKSKSLLSKEVKFFPLCVVPVETGRQLLPCQRNHFTSKRDDSGPEVGWLVGCFGFNSPLRQYVSLYQAVSQREGNKER